MYRVRVKFDRFPEHEGLYDCAEELTTGDVLAIIRRFNGDSAIVDAPDGTTRTVSRPEDE